MARKRTHDLRPKIDHSRRLDAFWVSWYVIGYGHLGLLLAPISDPKKRGLVAVATALMPHVDCVDVYWVGHDAGPRPYARYLKLPVKGTGRSEWTIYRAPWPAIWPGDAEIAAKAAKSRSPAKVAPT